MKKKPGISISPINLKMNLVNILEKFPRLRKSSLSLHFFKDYAKRGK